MIWKVAVTGGIILVMFGLLNLSGVMMLARNEAFRAMGSPAFTKRRHRHGVAHIALGLALLAAWLIAILLFVSGAKTSFEAAAIGVGVAFVLVVVVVGIGNALFDRRDLTAPERPDRLKPMSP